MRFRKLISLLLILALTVSFFDSALAGTLILPYQLRRVESEAFRGNSAIDDVYLPQGAESIGDYAFADSGASTIYIPDTVTAIGEGAFSGTEDLIIRSSEDSYARTYAEAHGLTWEDSEADVDLDELYGFIDDDSEITLQESFTYVTGVEGFSSELPALVADYDATIGDLAGLFNDLGGVLTANGLTVQDGEISMSIDSFTYSITGDAPAEGYEIVSTELIGDVIKTEIRVGGVTSYIVMGPDGTSFCDAPTLTGSVQRRSRAAIDFFDAAEQVFACVGEWANRFIDIFSNIDTAINLAVTQAQAVYDAALSEYNLLRSASVVDINAFAAAKNDLAAAEQLLENSQWAQGKWSSWVAGKGSKFGIIGSLIGIGSDINQYYTKIKPLREHGHPTKLEESDPYAVVLSDELDRGLRSATAALRDNVFTNLLSILLDCSGIMSKIALCVPGTQPFAVALNVGIIALKAAVGVAVTIRNIHGGIMLNHYIQEAQKTDAKLHTVVCGYITDSMTDKPLENVSVTDGVRAVVTGAAGYYRFYMEPGVPATLLYTLHGYKRASFTVTPVANKTTPHDVELKPKSLILTREDLEAVAEDPEDDYIVGADIDLSDAPWTPLPALRGSIDGDGHTISGMRIEGTYANSNVGLFTDLEGRISNLNLTGVTINIHATGGFCNATAFGLPLDVWDSGASTTLWHVADCRVESVVTIHADDGCWAGYCPLAGARRSSTASQISLWGTHITENVLWNCYSCTGNGTLDVTYTGEPQAYIVLIKDGLSSQADFNVNVNQNGQPLDGSNFTGIQSQNIASQGCKVSGNVYHESYSHIVWGGGQGADSCESDMYIRSDRITGLDGCTNSRLGGTFETLGQISDVYACFVNDAEGDGECGNTCDVTYVYTEPVTGAKPANLFVSATVGRGTVINTPVSLEDITLTNVGVSFQSRTYREGVYEGAEANEQFRNGSVSVVTTTGSINIYSELSTEMPTSARSQSGQINIIAGSYNKGNVSARSDSNRIQITAATKYNSGAVVGVTGVPASDTSYVTGVYGENGYNEGSVTGIGQGPGIINVSGANGQGCWNEGAVSASGQLTGGTGNCVYAMGVFGQDGVNKGEVTATGTGAAGETVFATGVNGANGWNDAPVTATSEGSATAGAVGCTNGVNLGTITATSATGFTSAAGIENGGHNSGAVSASTGADYVNAWGARYSGTNSGYVTAETTSDYEFAKAYADAQGGSAYASGQTAHASGRFPTAHSLHTGQTVSGDGYGWELTGHNHGPDDPCGAPARLITSTSHHGVSSHTYQCWADSQATGDAPGLTPDAPTKPELSWPSFGP